MFKGLVKGPACCEQEMRAGLSQSERAVASKAAAFPNAQLHPDVEVRWHLGETWGCPWQPHEVHGAEGVGTVAVLRSMTEKDRLSPVLLACCGVVHETWVPTEWHRKLYHHHGCKNARALPEVVDSSVFRPKRFRAGPSGRKSPNDGRTLFLSVFQWQARKGPDALLQAYWQAFTKADAVVLRIRSRVPSWAGLPFSSTREGVEHYAQQLHRKDAQQLAAVETIEGDEMTRDGMSQLFRDADAFVLPSRGEGWCLPCAEAMASDTLLIASDFSGMTEFANTANSLPVRCPVPLEGEGHCEPDVQGLAWRMRWAHEHPAEAAALGRRGGEDIRQSFGVRAVADTWRREAARAVKQHFSTGLELHHR